MNYEQQVKVTDSHGFQYEVLIKHSPSFGFSTAYYNGEIIEQVELGKIHEPTGDDDREWEQYEELFAEWSDEIMVNMNRLLPQFFNRQP